MEWFIVAKFVDFLITTGIPVIVSLWFVKNRLLANLACFILSIVVGMTVSAVFDFILHDLDQMKEQMLKIPTDLAINIVLLNIIFGSGKKLCVLCVSAVKKNKG